MWQSTVWRGSPPSSSTMSSTVAPSRNQPGRWTISGSLVRAWARTAPRSDFPSSGVNSDETPISPIRPMRTPSMPSSASATISSAMASIDIPASAGGCELCR